MSNGNSMSPGRLSICNLGIMHGLGNITSIPATGFTIPMIINSEVSCEVGHGYVIKYGYPDDATKTFYIRLYVVESRFGTDFDTGAKIPNGAIVKYQYPFEP